jgi:flagellar operon protein
MAVNGVKITAYQQPVNLIEIANRGKEQATTEKSAESFKDMFSRELAGERGVTVSKHASERLYSRNMQLSDERLQQVAGALDKAEGKGSRETLIMFDDLALVASVKNRTIITAFDRDNLKEGVVTSIDSAVIL